MTTPTHRFTRPITATLSAEALGHLEQWEAKTGLSRSRLLDMAVMATATGDETLVAALAVRTAGVWEVPDPKAARRARLIRDAARAANAALQPPQPKQPKQARKGKAQ